MKIIQTDKAPAAIGPYVQGRVVGNFVYTSGQIPLDPATGALVGEGDVAAQAKRSFESLRAVVEAGGAKLEDVVKTTIFLKDMNDFATVNGVYSEFFGEHKPARSCVEVARLPKDVLIEIECIAFIA